MAKIKDTSFLGEKLTPGDLVVVATKSGVSDFCWALVARFMGSTIMIQELGNPENIRRVKDALVVHIEDIETTLGKELYPQYIRLKDEIIKNG